MTSDEKKRPARRRQRRVRIHRLGPVTATGSLTISVTIPGKPEFPAGYDVVDLSVPGEMETWRRRQTRRRQTRRRKA